MKKTYLVTGGAGFIGSHIVDRLMKQGNRVVVIDDLSGGRKQNIEHHLDSKNFAFYQQSILYDIGGIFKQHNVDVVLHQAALPRVQFSIEFPMESHSVNTTGTLNVLDTAYKHGVKRFIYAGSSSAYGEQKRLPYKEEMLVNPLSPYALQKFTGEMYCKLYHNIHNMETIVLRYFNVFGPRQDPNGAYAGMIPRFFEKYLSGEAPIIYGDGRQTRDNTYIDSVVDVNMLAIKTKNKEAFGQTFNIGGGQQRSVNEVAQKIQKLVGSDIKPQHGPAVVEARRSEADTSKAQKILGWEPQDNFDECLRKTADYYIKLHTGEIK